MHEKQSQKYYLLSIFILILSFFLLPQLSFAKNYSIPSVSIEATINKDGSVDFMEERSFNFDGHFTFGYYDLSKTGYNSLEDFFIYEGDIPYFYSKNEENGSYYIEDMGDKYRVRFFYEAENEIKTFTFKYKLSGVVKVYEDFGEFYWKLQGIG